MNEFEWLRQARALNTPEPPARDLWATIEQRIASSAASAATAPRRRALTPWAMAAAIALVSLLAGGLARYSQLRAGLTSSTPMLAAESRWQPDDPRLAGAAVEFHAARSELAGAIAQAPRAAFLRRLMKRTREQEQRLRRQHADAG